MNISDSRGSAEAWAAVRLTTDEVAATWQTLRSPIDRSRIAPRNAGLATSTRSGT